MNNQPIRLLDPATVSKIASGEVIERPISAIKELVENALDAGASRVEVAIRDGGTSLIEVRDNGHGIAKDQLQLAMTNHATSKVADGNIDNLLYFGFRGEALAAIRSVAKLQIIANSNDTPAGWSLSGSGMEIGDPLPHGRARGTSVIVRDLFCFTPNRLRFLPSKQAENTACLTLMHNFLLANPNTAFGLEIDGRVALDCPADLPMEERIAMVMGKAFWEDSMRIDYRDSYLSATGYAILPTSSSRGRGKMMAFVNQRIVKDAKIYALIKAGYSGLIEPHARPSALLFIETDHRHLDVNIHPDKTSIRFNDDNALKKGVINAIREALKKSPVSAEVIHDFIARRREAAADAQMMQGTWHGSPAATNPGLAPALLAAMSGSSEGIHFLAERESDLHNSYLGPRFPQPAIGREQTVHDHLLSLYPQQSSDTAVFSHTESTHQPQSGTKLGQAIYQLQRLYIVAVVREEDAIIIVDQHAAHERIVLQAMKRDFGQHMERQKLLWPQEIQLPRDDVETLLAHSATLARFGFTIEAQDIQNTADLHNAHEHVAISSIPAVIGGISDLSGLLQKLVERVAADPGMTEEIATETIEHIASDIACHSSIRAGRILSLEEMNALLRKMEEVDFSSQCNHGRPTYFKLSATDLARLFHRR